MNEYSDYTRSPSKVRIREQNKRLNSRKYQKVLDFVKAQGLHETSPATKRPMNVGAEDLKMLKEYQNQRVRAAIQFEREKEEFQRNVRDFYIVPKPLDYKDRTVLLNRTRERASSSQPERTSVLRDLEPLKGLMYQKKVVTDQILNNVFNKPRADCLLGAGDKRFKRA